MADINVLAPFILSWEGGYVNHPNDKGGATKYGVTLAQWKIAGYDKDGDGDIDANDIKLLSVEDYLMVFRRYYWDVVQADLIKDQAVANIIVDFCYNSGIGKIKQIQSIVGAFPDGKVGKDTLLAINTYKGGQQALFKVIWNYRYNFYVNIAKNNPSQKVFLNGWLNRLNSIGYTWLKYGNKKHTFNEGF